MSCDLLRLPLTCYPPTSRRPRRYPRGCHVPLLHPRIGCQPFFSIYSIMGRWLNILYWNLLLYATIALRYSSKEYSATILLSDWASHTGFISGLKSSAQKRQKEQRQELPVELILGSHDFFKQQRIHNHELPQTGPSKFLPFCLPFILHRLPNLRLDSSSSSSIKCHQNFKVKPRCSHLIRVVVGRQHLLDHRDPCKLHGVSCRAGAGGRSQT